MRVIVTGGTGLIGTALTKKLVEDGYEVVVLSRSPSKYTLPNGIRAEKWDAKTAVGWGHLADGAHAIVNLAGENIAGSGLFPQRWTEARKQRIRQSRLHAGQAVTEAVRQATNKPQLVVQASGIDYYANGARNALETDPPGNSFLANVITQYWEPSTAEVETMGVRRVVLRMGLVLSPDGGPLPILVLQHNLFAGGPLGSGQQCWPWLHIDDAANAWRFFVNSDTAQGVFNLATPNPVTNKQFSKILGSVMGRPSLIPAPAFALKLALGEISSIVLEGREINVQKLLNTGFEFEYPTLRPALEALLKK